MGSAEFDCDAELCRNWGYPLDPNKKSQNQIDAERKAALYHRIEELERRVSALERKGEDDGK